ncbi:hypothetical protein G3I44_15665 [Halogeometricum borinquense]|uniref:Uncharacterized protein n=1 Tax=Halogeometricum borinquense TaxID=60847 RepID=A0A6C0UJD4_9EURY|nr:hypothetical protein [Halogeometricum borinquense]QIB75602.1 hypothetical protein G3I44_15665 [Halogeometricum borinquense]
MNLPGRTEFAQLRRLLPVGAAVLLLGALLLPMWSIEMHAVQYPNEPLHLSLYAYPRVSGDFVEIHRLNKYIGFYYPDPVFWQPNYEPHPRAIDVPEWSLGPLAFVGVAATSVFVALAPTARKLRRGLTLQLVGAVAVFAGLLADIQFRLYQAGHTLDPDAPVMGVEGFTPPLLGTYSVANITSYSRFGAGAYLTMLAIGLLVVSYAARNSTVTLWEVPEYVRNRFTGDDETTEPTAGTTSERASAPDASRTGRR